MELARYFEMGGWTMYPLFLLLLLALAASLGLPVIGFAVGKPRLAFLFAMLLAVLGLLAAGLGAAGQAMGVRQVEEAVAHVHPEDAQLILLVGRGEARVNLVFGLLVAALPLGAAFVCLGRGVTERLSGLAVGGGLLLGLGVTVAVGAFALSQGSLVQVETTLAHVEPALRGTLAAAGRAQAARAMAAVLAAAPLCLVGGALLGVGARKAKQAQ